MRSIHSPRPVYSAAPVTAHRDCSPEWASSACSSSLISRCSCQRDRPSAAAPWACCAASTTVRSTGRSGARADGSAGRERRAVSVPSPKPSSSMTSESWGRDSSTTDYQPPVTQTACWPAIRCWSTWGANLLCEQTVPSSLPNSSREILLPVQPPPFDSADQDRMVVLADLGARCRSPIVRDRYKSDAVELVPDPEHPARLLGSLGQLAAGMRVIGTPKRELWRLIGQVAVGGVHPTRRRIIEVLIDSTGEHATAAIAGHCRLPPTTVRRSLGDLVALDVVEFVGPSPDRWMASEWLRESWRTVTGELP